MTSHWGDMPAVGDTDSAFAKMERDQLTKRRPMEIHGPRLYQTYSKQYSTSTKPAPPEKFHIDPLTLHTIRLLQHIRKMKNLIQQVTFQHENAKPDAELTFPATLPVPEYSGPDIKPKMTKPFSHLPYARESEFVRGIGEEPPIIDGVACRKLLRRSVSAICAHIGFENSKESCLELMTDIVQEYYSRIMKHMRSAVDNQLLHEQIGFPDVVEQVFHECGIGSVMELHEFYQNRILRYHENMLQQSQQLVAEYEKLKQFGGPKPAETFTLIRIRDEPSSDIHFPELEEKDDVADSEHLLHLKDLTAYEITVEQEPVTGLTTDIDSKIASNIKSENDVRLPYLDVEDGAGGAGNLMTTAAGVTASASGASGGSVVAGSGGSGGAVGGGGVGTSSTKDGCLQQQLSAVTPAGGDCLSEANGTNLSMSDILPPLINARSNKTRKLLSFLEDDEDNNNSSSTTPGGSSSKGQDHPWLWQPSKQSCEHRPSASASSSSSSSSSSSVGNSTTTTNNNNNNNNNNTININNSSNNNSSNNNSSINNNMNSSRGGGGGGGGSSSNNNNNNNNNIGSGNIGSSSISSSGNSCSGSTLTVGGGGGSSGGGGSGAGSSGSGGGGASGSGGGSSNSICGAAAAAAPVGGGGGGSAAGSGTAGCGSGPAGSGGSSSGSLAPPSTTPVRSSKKAKLSNYMDNEETVNLPRESKRQKLHDENIADSSAATPPPPPLIPMRTPKSKKAKSKSGQSFSRQSAAAAKKSDK